MDVYIYQADFYCKNCISKIQESLALNEIPGDDSTYDSDEHPKGPFSNGGGEADCPNHCGRCGCFLENLLTSDGYNYVQEALEQHLHTGSECIGQWFDHYNFSVESSESY